MSTFKTLFMGVGFAAIATLSACSSSSNASLTQSGLNPADFDSTVLGKKTELVTLKNANGMEVCLTNYGGRVVSISVPDKDGKPTDVVLGYDNIHQYADTLNSPSDYGSSVGRYANRIKDAVIKPATHACRPDAVICHLSSFHLGHMILSQNNTSARGGF